MFAKIGYAIDYYVAGKYVGYIVVNEKDREQVGYFGRKVETMKEDLILKNGKKIKAGIEVKTELIEMQGRLIEKLKTGIYKKACNKKN